MAAGDILSCEVLATGWQAKVVIDNFVDGGTYDFGAIDTDVANAKFVMTVVSEGYNASGTLGTITRTVYGTRVCQKASPNQATREETEAGGDVELTIALSDYVYDDDNTGTGKSGTAPTVTVASGFYTDNGTGGSSAANNAAAALAVTNSSTQDYPKVAGMRWATVPFQKFTATFDVEMVCFHRHAANGKPVAAVKFNDGTTDTFVTAMSQSAAADSLPCYKHTLDATNYSANADVTVNITAYPWVGDADSVVTSVGGSVNALTLGPIKLRADKTSSTPVYYAVVDTAGNDTTGVASTTYATAAASPCLSIRKAVDLISTANGGNADFGLIYLNAGSQATGTAGNGACTNGWVTVMPNPNTGATKATAKIAGAPGSYVRGFLKLQGITIEPTGYVLGGAAGRFLWIDDCAVNRATYSTTQPFGEYPHIYVTHSTSDKVNAFGPNGAGNVGALIRGCSATDTIGISGAAFGGRTLLTTTIDGMDTRALALCDISASNTVIAYCRVLRDANTGNACITGGGAFDDVAIVGNLLERTDGTQTVLSLWSDGNTTPNTNLLVWHNTVVGERSNIGYNDTGTTAVARKLYSVKYNAMNRIATKHDTFTTASGNRIGAWSVLYGVGWVGNHTESTDTSFPHENGEGYGGIRWTHATAAGYVSDQSGTSGVGGGDYTPDTGSALIGKIATAADVVIPWDINGVAYAAGGCAGAITLAGTTAYSLTVDAGSYGVTGSDAGLYAHRALSGDPGSYALTGSDASLLLGRVLAADAGSYGVIGSDASVLHSRVLAADAGAYSLTGSDASFLRAYVLTADTGAYAVDGVAADLVRVGALEMTAEPGVYALTGADAVLRLHRVLTADPGSYAVTGADASSLRAYVLSADAGAYVLTGSAATTAYSGLVIPQVVLLGGPVTSRQPSAGTLTARRVAAGTVTKRGQS